jgi:hypothetical protein
MQWEVCALGVLPSRSSAVSGGGAGASASPDGNLAGAGLTLSGFEPCMSWCCAACSNYISAWLCATQPVL